MKRLLVFLTCLCAIFLIVRPRAATVFTVGSGKTFATPALCSATAGAGDTCDIFTGSYAGWTQATSGTSGNPITFQAHAGETVTITSGVTLTDKNDITITGLIFTGGGIQCGNGDTHVCAGLVISHNTMSTTSTGNVVGIKVFGDGNLIDSNNLTHFDGDCMDLGGANVVVRNNYCHDVDGASSGEHIDFIQVTGGQNPTLSFSLVENNVEQNCTNDLGDCHFIIVRTSGVGTADTIIVRYNYFQNLNDSGAVNWGGVGDNVPNSHFYNNTDATETKFNGNGACASYQNASNGVAKNNICYNTNSSGTAPFFDFSSGGFVGNGNLAFTMSFSGSWNSPYSTEATYAALHNQNPLFANYPADGTVQGTSPALNAGVALTAVNASDTGSGTSLIVNDAAFFQPGWAGVPGDWIRIGASTTAQISAIAYATNTLTLTSSPTRASGDAVMLLKRTDGTVILSNTNTVPDVGAFPSGSPAVSVNRFFGAKGEIR